MIEEPEYVGDMQAEPVAEPENIRDEKGRFKKGFSGGGYKFGKSRHRSTVLAQQIFDGEAEGMARKAIELALAGDTTAMRLVIERIVPQRKSAPVQFDLPAIETTEDAKRAIAAVIRAQAEGELTQDEADGFMKSIEMYIKVSSLADIEARIARLEG